MSVPTVTGSYLFFDRFEPMAAGPSRMADFYSQPTVVQQMYWTDLGQWLSDHEANASTMPPDFHAHPGQRY